MPKFSIIIPAIKAQFLDQAIDSVLAQTFSDWEIVLYDDCSPDDIKSIIDKYAIEKIKYFRGEKNIGKDDPSITWNKALSFANGEFVCLLGDDDYISENYLEKMNLLINKFQGIDVFRAKLKRVNEENEIISSNENLPEREAWYESMFQRNVGKRMQSTCEFVLRRNPLIKIGGYVHFPRACGSDDATYLLLSKTNGIVSTNEAFGFWRKSSLNISDNDSMEINEHKIKFLLSWEKKFLDAAIFAGIDLYKLYESLDFDKKKEREHFESISHDFEIISQEFKKINEDLQRYKDEVQNVYVSREWKMAMFLRNIFKKIIPKNSIRRKFIIVALKFAKKSVKLLFKIKKSFKNLFFLIKLSVFKYKRKRERKINLKSKKIVFVGHSYHQKTRSSEFLVEYLKEFFDVETIYDKSWQNNDVKYPDLTFIDDSYLGVVFFQNLPSKEILNSIKNQNIIFFPMYDGVPHDLIFWKDYYDLKIFNFSKTLHEDLKKWGFESEFTHYFPKVSQFLPGKTDEIFFWQRHTKFNINVIVKLFKENIYKIHLHQAIDPNQNFEKPTKKQEVNYEITYSKWFETREEMWDAVVKRRGIFIAPREFEGIGLSFLEAMAMGKAVVAIDNPTMNEYIEHGKNGYLFDLNKPKEIDFSDIERVQKKSYEFMKNGFEIWEKEKENIIKFIKK